MEAPEKIYLSDFTDTTEAVFYVKKDNTKKTDIEYSRTDALIDKAAIWFNNNFIVHDEYGVISDSFDTKEEMFEDFKNYMKGD